MAMPDFLKQMALEKRQQDLAAALTKYNRLAPRGAWNPIRRPVHFYLLNGVQSAGLCSFPKLECIEKWDKVTGPGLSGGISVFRGNELVEFDAVHRLYDDEDWSRFHVMLPMLQRATRGKRPQAMRILHPILDFFSPPIRAVVKPRWSLSEPDEYGVTTFTVSYLEFFNPKVDQAKPDAAKPSPVADPWDKLIDKMKGELETEGKKLEQ
jgi:hypothetical protein